MTINLLLIVFLGIDIFVTDAFIPELVIFYQVITFLIFPFYFLYGMEVIRFNFSLKVLFFVPTLALTLFMITDFYFIHERSYAYAELIYRYPTLIYHFFYKGQLVFSILGQLWFLRRIHIYQREIRNEYSNVEQIELRWLRQVTIAFIAITAFALIAYLVYNFNTELIDIETVTKAINGISILAVFYMSYNGIKLYTIRNHYRLSEVNYQHEKQLQQADKKYSRSNLTEETLADIHERLIEVFEKEKPFLEPQLQLQQVAQKLNVGTHALSQTINTIEKKTFYDFVNAYRIEHFKTLLVNPDNKKFSILGLGMDSGFNSKASMNRIFKELTGHSPSAYQKINQKEVLLSQ
jgi:AraC-like DNA-binding protein